MEQELSFYLVTIALLLAGSATHIIKKVVERRKTDDTFQMKTFLTKYPYKTILTVMAGVAGYLGLLAAGELSLVSAYMTGYVANSLGGAAE